MLEEHVYQQLNNAHKHLKVYQKGKTPEHWHFNHHPRVTPIVALADLGWSITSHAYFESHKSAFQGGSHGYDPSEPAMNGIFVASGPLISPGTQLGKVESIHLYELMCFLLQIDPSANRGSLDVWTGNHPIRSNVVCSCQLILSLPASRSLGEDWLLTLILHVTLNM